MQYDTTINDWHTSAVTGRINASNPCSEYMFLDDTSCNLASINLTRFLNDDGSIDIEAYKHAIHITITAQEILVSNASYPTEKITKNSEEFRPLGLGYANLGALLMARGVPYDSPQGRDLAACLTSILTGEAYAQSARIAREIGPFNGYAANRQPMLRVVGKHREAAYNIPTDNIEPDLVGAARHAWDEAHELGARHGYRNAQATVLAPTGTISFMLDCDTTGVEPDIALVKYKKLVGGGMLKMVNGTVPAALRRLGYGETAIGDIIAFIDANDTIEGAPTLRDEDVAVFDCAFTPQNGKRSITWQGHLRMMAAVQPFISGAISKTVNMPNEATVEDIERAYTDGWKLGLKAVAIYRDGSKRSQPLATSIDKTTGHRVQVVERPLRKRLPAERTAITHKFEVGGHEGYITVGLYEDGTPGEIFLRMAKEGSTVSGLMDSFATAVSLALQYGVPLPALVDKFSHTRFDPQGFTRNPEIPIAKSVMDYIFRWLASRFLPQEDRDRLGIIRREPDGTATEPVSAAEAAIEAMAPVTVAPAATARKPVAAIPTHQRRRIHQPGRRTHLQRLRQPHGAQRRLLQVPQLRRHERLQLTTSTSSPLARGRLRPLEAAPLSSAASVIRPCAHFGGNWTHQRQQPVQRVHVPRRHQLQPGVDQPDPLPQRRRLDRHRGLQTRDSHHDHRPGDPGQQRLVPDREDHQEQRGLSPARPRLCEPRCAPDGPRRPLRFPAGSRSRRLPHVDPHR